MSEIEEADETNLSAKKHESYEKKSTSVMKPKIVSSEEKKLSYSSSVDKSSEKQAVSDSKAKLKTHSTSMEPSYELSKFVNQKLTPTHDLNDVNVTFKTPDKIPYEYSPEHSKNSKSSSSNQQTTPYKHLDTIIEQNTDLEMSNTNFMRSPSQNSEALYKGGIANSEKRLSNSLVKSEQQTIFKNQLTPKNWFNGRPLQSAECKDLMSLNKISFLDQELTPIKHVWERTNKQGVTEYGEQVFEFDHSLEVK